MSSKALAIGLAIALLLSQFFALPLAALDFEWAAAWTLVTLLTAGLYLLRPYGFPTFLALALIGPLLSIPIGHLLGTVCDGWMTIAWWLLLPVGALIPVATLVFLLSAFDRAAVRLSLFAALTIGSLLLRFLLGFSLGPQLFLLDPFWGYAAGPIYDFGILPSLPLFAIRAEGFTIALLLVLFRFRPWRGVIACAAVIPAFQLLYILLPSLGVVTTWHALNRALPVHSMEGHVTLSAFPGYEIASESARAVLLDLAQRQREIASRLGIEPSRAPAYIYLYATPDEKKRLIGARDVAIGDFVRNAIHVDEVKVGSPLLHHELVHVVARTLAPLGGPLSPAIFEGLAVALSSNPDPSARVLLEHNELPELEALLSPIRFWALPMARAYDVAGSFIKFLLARYPIEAFHCWYRGERFSTCYSAPLSTLESEWREYLNTVEISAGDRARATERVSEPAGFSVPCVHAVHRVLNAHPHSSEELSKALLLSQCRSKAAARALLRLEADLPCALSPSGPSNQHEKEKESAEQHRSD